MRKISGFNLFIYIIGNKISEDNDEKRIVLWSAIEQNDVKWAQKKAHFRSYSSSSLGLRVEEYGSGQG